MNNTRQKINLKIWRQHRREQILKDSYKKKLGDNLCIFLEGVIQKGKYAISALLLAFCLTASAQTNTNTIPQTPQDFFIQVEGYLTSHNPTYAGFITDSTFAWTGAEYIQGVNTANIVGVSHDLWKSSTLTLAAAQYATNYPTLLSPTVSGSTFGVEAVIHNEGVAGTVESADIGINYNLVIGTDLKLGVFVDGCYNLISDTPYAAFGFDAKKAFAAHAYGGLRIYERTDLLKQHSAPTVAITAGFSF